MPKLEQIYYDEIQRKDGLYVSAVVPNTDAADAANYPEWFFIARHPCEVIWAAEIHGNASSASPATLQLRKTTGTQDIVSGSRIEVTAWDLTGTANTVVEKIGNDFNDDARQLKQGDRLGLYSPSTLTDLAHVCVTVYLKMIGQGDYR